MTEPQTQSMPEVADIAAEVLEVFCDDLAGMFDTDTGCIRRDVTSSRLDDLKNGFAHLEAVCSFKAEGAINGNFHLFLDREGSVTLAALLTATPRNEVLAKRTRASKEDADELHDAIAEAANILAASWERTCRGAGEAQIRFAQTNTLVGDPWPQLRQSAALAPEDEIVALYCQMTIDPYPPFPLALIFPKALAADSNWSSTLPREAEKQQAPTDPELLQPSPEPASQSGPAEPQEQGQPEITDSANEPQSEPQPAEQSPQDHLEPEAIDAPQPEPTQQPLQEQPTSAADQPAPAPQPESPLPETQPQRVDQLRREQPEIAAQPETSEAAPAQECGVNPHESAAEPPNSEPETGPVSDAIKRMTASESEQSAPPPHPCPEQGPALPLSTPAAEIMRTDLAWADAEDTVEAVLAKMQEHNVSHVIVGQKLAPQGIVSRSDIAGAVSPYLRPTFAKWRRPLDDATLRIKVKWIMSTPLTTIASDTPLSAIMEQMQQLHKRALPVVGAQGAIVGMITAYDIFAALLKPAPAQ